jgi:hypothetical protein
MKRKIAPYVSECDTCWKVKADYMKPGGLLQPLSVSHWKWDDWTVSNSGEVWEGGIQVRVTTVIVRSSRYLPRIAAKEVFEGTRGCCITGSGTARHGSDVSRTSD